MTHFSFQQMALVCGAACVFVSVIQLPVKSQAKFSSKFNTTSIHFVQPVLAQEPENRGAPDDRKGAGSRGGCPAVMNKPLLTGIVPLVESTKTLQQKQPLKMYLQPSKFVLGLTVSQYPTFWFYVPYSPNDVNSVKFVLLDNNNNYVTKKPIPVTISGTPAVISVTLPKTEKPLEVGKFYHWFLSVDCQTQNQSEDTVVEGLVQRIQPNNNLMHRFETATPRERVALYAQAGIWQDALTLLGELRRTQPQDHTLVSAWKNLLSSVELQNIAGEPIAPCCQP